MSDRLQTLFQAIRIEREVANLRPDYHVALVLGQDLTAGASDAMSDALLTKAERSARAALADLKPEQLPHVAAWREAYRAFGAKPQRTRNSAEALLRRVSAGLPRINRLTDIYNAVSIEMQVPLGGEDFSAYRGAARLVRADGTEPFETIEAGSPVVEHPEPGEVVWRDDLGVTCRRWNWRQCHRTGLTDKSTTALFICDVLDSETGPALDLVQRCCDRLLDYLRRSSPRARIEVRIVGNDHSV